MEDEDMPTDEHGNRADIITDSSSTISRMNLGRVYESYLGAVARDARKSLINYLTDKNKTLDMCNLKKENIDYFHSYLRGLYALINKDMVEFIDSLNPEELLNHIQEVITDNLYLYYPPDNEYNAVDIVSSIETSIYKPVYTQVTYKDNLNRVVKSKEKIRIGNMYIMALEKIADDYMAIASAKVNNFSFPVKGSSLDKYRYQHSLTPTKTLGETEVRIFTSYMSSMAAAELMDINTNPNSHKLTVKCILESNKPMKDFIGVDRQTNPYGKNKPLLIFKHISNAFGFNFRYIDEKEGSV